MIEKLQLMTLMFIGDLGNLKARRDERGATAVEYGLLVALIAAIIIVSVTLLGKQINVAFTAITSKLPAVP